MMQFALGIERESAGPASAGTGAPGRTGYDLMTRRVSAGTFTADLFPTDSKEKAFASSRSSIVGSAYPPRAPAQTNKSAAAGNVEKMVSIVTYTLCSASMLLINKLVMKAIPLPSLVSIAQFAVSCIAVLIAWYTGATTIERFRREELAKYMIYACAFTAGLYCNMKSLELSSVETVIVFRACTPLAQACLDYLFLDRAMPSTRSLAALVGIALGALLYVRTDSEFQMKGVGAYYWVSAYFVLLCFQMTYGKMITNAMKYSISSTVLYNNALSIPPMLLFGVCMGELEQFRSIEITWFGIAMLVLSCILGTGISYTGWWCRSLTTATTYTTLGVLCKLGTVLLNLLVWGTHASATGLAALAVCLFAGTMYTEAPARVNKMRGILS